MYLNYYECSYCGHEWTDEYDSMCDDDCPNCKERHITPFKSEVIPESKGFQGSTEMSVNIDLIDDLIRCLNYMPNRKIEGLKSFRIIDGEIYKFNCSYDVAGQLDRLKKDFVKQTTV